MAGFRNETMYANNVDFSGAAIAAPQVTTDGQLLIGSTATPNIKVGTLTSPDSSVTIGYSAPNITLAVAGASGFVEHLTGNTGGQLNPTANNFNTVGAGSITIDGSGSTLTTQLTGITNNAIQVGAGTATLTQLGPTNRAVLTTSAAGVPTLTALTDGQLIIGSTAGAPAASTLTAGSGISITNGSNSITIAATGAGFTWTDVTTATQALAVSNGYVTDRSGGVTYTLPATAVLGDTIKIVGKLGLTTVAQNANQQIFMSSSSSTVGTGGSIAGTNVGDCVTLVCTTGGSSTVWRAESFVGNWTIT